MHFPAHLGLFLALASFPPIECEARSVAWTVSIGVLEPARWRTDVPGIMLVVVGGVVASMDQSISAGVVGSFVAPCYKPAPLVFFFNNETRVMAS